MKRALDSEELSQAKKAKVEVYEGVQNTIHALNVNSGGFLSSIYRELFPFYPVLSYFHLCLKKDFTRFFNKEWSLKRINEQFHDFVTKHPEYSSSLDNPKFQDFLAGKIEAEEMVSFFKDLDTQIHADKPRDIKSFFQILNSRKYASLITNKYEMMALTWREMTMKIKPKPFEGTEFFEFFLISTFLSFDKKGTIRPFFPQLKAFLKENEGNPLLNEFKALMRGKNYQLMVILLFGYLCSFAKDNFGFVSTNQIIFPEVEEEILTQYGQLWKEKAFDKPENWKLIVKCLMTLLCILVSKIQ